MCVLVKYVSPIDKKVKIQLLELLILDATNCSAKKIFEIFKNFFLENKIPLKNIIGMASDNASVMIGRNNSFYLHLKSETPNLIMLNCICHALFQSRKILIHKLFINKIIQIAQNFVIFEALNNIAILNIDDEKNIKHLTDIYVGQECENFLTTQFSEFAQQIKYKCLDFYKTTFKEMIKRLPKGLAGMGGEERVAGAHRDEMLIQDGVSTMMADIRKQLLASLWLLATSDSYKSVGERFDICKSSLSVSFMRVIDALNEITDDMIQWL
ncbi:ZBED8 protein, partial [Acromyrmex heyeri]